VALIDFAPTLAELLDIPVPKNATGRVLAEVFAVPR
jgi:arylsulfatase A-like enzyme